MATRKQNSLALAAAPIAAAAVLLAAAMMLAPFRTEASADAETTGPSAPTACHYPAELIDLTNWKLTLPVGSAGSPTEITQPDLATYSTAPYFAANQSCSGVQFQAPTNGVTTPGTTYPRSELREMTSNGTAKASWSTSVGTHIMGLTEAITSVPFGKKQIIAAQIHDAIADITTVRLAYPKLFIDHNGSRGKTLSSNYVLGTPFSVEWIVSNNQIMTYYNGTLVETYAINDSGLYFKAGAYTQSNCTTEASHGYTCSDSNYGQVVIYRLVVKHLS